MCDLLSGGLSAGSGFCLLGGLAVDPFDFAKTRPLKLCSLLSDLLRHNSIGWRALSKLEIELDESLCVCDFSSGVWRPLSFGGRDGVSPSSGESTPLRESFVLLLPDKLREALGESEYTEDTLAIDAALAGFSFFTSPPAPPPTGRRGIAIEGFIASLGKGGKSVLEDLEGIAAGGFSDLAGVSPGGTGNTFENLERPLPGVDGKDEYIF